MLDLKAKEIYKNGFRLKDSEVVYDETFCFNGFGSGVSAIPRSRDERLGS
jgi:hypothetical protein